MTCGHVICGTLLFPITLMLKFGWMFIVQQKKRMGKRFKHNIFVIPTVFSLLPFQFRRLVEVNVIISVYPALFHTIDYYANEWMERKHNWSLTEIKENS